MTSRFSFTHFAPAPIETTPPIVWAMRPPNAMLATSKLPVDWFAVLRPAKPPSPW